MTPISLSFAASAVLAVAGTCVGESAAARRPAATAPPRPAACRLRSPLFSLARLTHACLQLLLE